MRCIEFIEMGCLRLTYNPEQELTLKSSVKTACSSYFFGMEMGGRYDISNPEPDSEYRYGFQGQEKDDEITGQTGSHYTAAFWEYDSRIGRRWNLDPKPNQSISSYATFANNPIFYSDPLGDTVQVRFRKGGFLGLRNNTLNYQNGNLYNRDGSEYTGKLSWFARETVSALNEISAGPKGGEAMQELINANNVFLIVNGSGNTFRPNSWQQAGLANQNIPSGTIIPGSGGKIEFNPSGELGGINTHGTRERPAFIALGHELIGHGLDANRGTFNGTLIPGYGFTISEQFATHMENILRAEHFISLRAFYAINANGNGIYPLLINGRQSMFFNNYDYYQNLKMPTIKPKTI